MNKSDIFELNAAALQISFPTQREASVAMSNPKQIAKTFCTTREAAEMLGVSLRTAQLWSESGLLEAWKTSGGHRRIARQSIERLLSGPGSDLPIQAEPDILDTEPAEDARGNAFSVMVVEDDPVLRRLYEINLRLWPMQPDVLTAGDGYEALVLLGLKRPDMLIADLQMPGLDGFRMLRTIQGAPELADMKIVVVSGLDLEDIESRGSIPAGIPILPKPIPFDRLATIAGQVLAERNAARNQKKEA
jgi:excisionase family DNA binding protein